jgi:hypothetical protein
MVDQVKGEPLTLREQAGQQAQTFFENLWLHGDPWAESMTIWSFRGSSVPTAISC